MVVSPKEAAMDHRLTAASIADSDKHYWHRYIETYLAAFARLGEVRRVIEFGVLHGASIRWLAHCFPGAEGMARLRPAGLYILEDIATSHPLHAGFAGHCIRNGRRVPNALNVLLAIQHMKDAGVDFNSDVATRLSAQGMLDERDVANLFA